MKILVLGGAGLMATGGVSYLKDYDNVSSIVMTDINLEAVDAVAATLNSDKISTDTLDVLNRNALINYAKDFDVVLNCVGPFTKFGVRILDAIIEAGVNYVDICDDHDAAQDLLKLDAKAKAAGVSALICMGTTPGISNVQARHIYDMLDECDSLKICWSIDVPPTDLTKGTPYEAMFKDSGRHLMSAGAWEHLIHVGTNNVPIWKNGKWDEIASMEHGEYVDFAEPLGRVEAYYLGHAEPITLAHFLDIKDFSACLGSIMPDVMRDLRFEARGHRESEFPPIDDGRERWVAPERWLHRGVWGGQAAIAEGTKDGKKVRITNRIMMGLKDMTPYNNSGQAIGTRMMGSGQITQKGVLAPEVCIDPKAFFEELAQCYTRDTQEDFTVDDLVLIQYEELN